MAEYIEVQIFKKQDGEDRWMSDDKDTFFVKTSATLPEVNDWIVAGADTVAPVERRLFDYTKIFSDVPDSSVEDDGGYQMIDYSVGLFIDVRGTNE